MLYWSGPATATTGIGVFTPGRLTALLAQSLSVPRTAFTLTLGVGNNSCTWNPSLIVAIPAPRGGRPLHRDGDSFGRTLPWDAASSL